MTIRKIISGGQTGADRAALDAALALGVPVGGWVPKGRRAEDGPIPGRYPGLRETDTDLYETRTRGPLTGGSKFTELVARSLLKREHRPGDLREDEGDRDGAAAHADKALAS